MAAYMFELVKPTQSTQRCRSLFTVLKRAASLGMALKGFDARQMHFCILQKRFSGPCRLFFASGMRAQYRMTPLTLTAGGVITKKATHLYPTPSHQHCRIYHINDIRHVSRDLGCKWQTETDSFRRPPSPWSYNPRFYLPCTLQHPQSLRYLGSNSAPLLTLSLPSQSSYPINPSSDMDVAVPATEGVQINRDAIISAANVLMVALLKMNRVLIPALLKWKRASRAAWIDAADDDLRRPKKKKRLPKPSNSSDDDDSEHDEDQHLHNVDREKFRRGVAPNLLVYTSFATVFFTISTIFIYSAIIITLVLSLFPFGPAEGIIFSFSLIATATISEAETLLQKGKTRTQQSRPSSAAAPGHMAFPTGAMGAGDEENGLLANGNNQRYGAMPANQPDDDGFSDLE